MVDRLDAMGIFIAVVEVGSLAGAARKLGLSPASVSRAVAQLEDAAGQRLIERSTRRLSLTEAGLHHANTYRTMLAELAKLEGQSVNADAEISGSVVVTAPELFGRLKIIPVVQSFVAVHPKTRVRLLLLNRMVDMVGEGIDVAIRLAHLPDSSLTAIKTGEVRRLTCAAPSYLDGRNLPERPADLVEHQCIGLNDAGLQEIWRFAPDPLTGRASSVRVTCRLSLNSAAAAIDAAERGMGIVRPLSYQVEQQIADGALVRILQDFEPEPMPVQLVFQPRRFTGGAVSAFIDHAKTLLRSFG